MKYLAIVSFVIGVLAAPIAAQAQQSLPGSPQGFNGLVWDPPTQTYVVPDATKEPSATHRPGRRYSYSAT